MDDHDTFDPGGRRKRDWASEDSDVALVNLNHLTGKTNNNSISWF